MSIGVYDNGRESDMEEVRVKDTESEPLLKPRTHTYSLHNAQVMRKKASEIAMKILNKCTSTHTHTMAEKITYLHNEPSHTYNRERERLK